MHFKVNIYLDGSILAPSELKDLTICNTTVDMVVNDVSDRERCEYVSSKNDKSENEVAQSA